MDLSLIEQAAQAQLETVAAAKGLKLKIDAYDGELDEDQWAKLAQTAPAALVAISGLKRVRKGVRNAEFTITVTVIVAANSLNDDMARRGGRGGKHVGAYALINYAVAALNGFGTDPALSPDPETPLMKAPLLVTGAQNLINSKVKNLYLAAYAVPFEGRVNIANALADDLDDLENIYVSSTPSPATDDGADTKPIEEDIVQQEIAK